MSDPLSLILSKLELKSPKILNNLKSLYFSPEKKMSCETAIARLFPLSAHDSALKANSKQSLKHNPLKVGAILSGGQAPGGHNVIIGAYEALKALNEKSELIGFLNGPQGLIDGDYIKLNQKLLAKYRNRGGFDLIGSGRTKIKTDEQLEKAAEYCKKLKLDGLIIIGGDDSNTNAAILAEYFLKHEINTKVVGVPKTIDGDLQNKFVEISFGFDTATKVYSELIGNICIDAKSSKKYYHFIKLMGRTASHVALECAHKTHPNFTLIGEEVRAYKWTLEKICKKIVDMIVKRSKENKDYGVILIPEGLLEFVPEMNKLFKELNEITTKQKSISLKSISVKLTEPSKKVFKSLPDEIKEQLLIGTDSHGNIQLAKIDTQKIILDKVKLMLKELTKIGKYNGSFAATTHYLGYEGRSGHPSLFDAEYCLALGKTAGLIINQGLTGYMACINGLKKSVESWQVYALPLTSLMKLQLRSEKKEPVINKALVDLQGKHYLSFCKKRDQWMMNDDYQCPGPIQFFGDEKITQSKPKLINLL